MPISQTPTDYEAVLQDVDNSDITQQIADGLWKRAEARAKKPVGLTVQGNTMYFSVMLPDSITPITREMLTSRPESRGPRGRRGNRRVRFVPYQNVAVQPQDVAFELVKDQDIDTIMDKVFE